jgi:AcrR family transcriptional regulator
MADLANTKILKIAIQTLEKDGWNGFSMRGLAKKLDVDPMAVYHYYPSKENLIHASIEKVFEGFVWEPVADLGQHSGGMESFGALASRKISRTKAKERNGVVKRVMGLLTSYRDFFLQYPNSCMYLLNHGYNDIPKLKEYNDVLVLSISVMEKDRTKATLIRDILIDYLHGYSMAYFAERNKPKRKLKEMEIFFETSLDFLIQRLLSK